MFQVWGGKPARWQTPSLNRSLISVPGPTEAIKLDLSDGAGDRSDRVHVVLSIFLYMLSFDYMVSFREGSVRC